MADAASIRKVKDIILGEESRKYVVVSAPGKRNKEDIKITDTLYKCYNDLVEKGDFSERFSLIRERFLGIAADLGLKSDFKAILDVTEKEIAEVLRVPRGTVSTRISRALNELKKQMAKEGIVYAEE